MSHRLPTVTLKCIHCKYCVKRPADNPYNGHSFDDAFAYTCPDCNSNLDVVKEENEEDVRTTDPVVGFQKHMSKMFNASRNYPFKVMPTEAFDKGDHPHPGKVWKTGPVTLEDKIEYVIQYVKDIEDEIVHHPHDTSEKFALGMALSNAKWELISAKSKAITLRGEHEPDSIPEPNDEKGS